MVRRSERAEIAAELARAHDGVVLRRDLRARGVSRDDERTEIRSGRWHLAGRQTIVIGSLEPQGRGRLWWAVWESGPGAVLDGVSALVAAGLTGFTPDGVDVAIRSRNRGHPLPGVRLHQRRDLGPVLRTGLPRTRVEWATIRAAQWAISERQAALLLALPIQQRLIPPERLLEAWRQVVRSPRRALLEQVIADVCDGAQSLGELDFAALCRRHGVPKPDRQVLRRASGRRCYLDAYWEAAQLVVEIDGSQHQAPLNVVDDALRQNELTLTADAVLRIPLLGLRLEPVRFMGQIRRHLCLE